MTTAESGPPSRPTNLSSHTSPPNARSSCFLSITYSVISHKHTQTWPRTPTADLSLTAGSPSELRSPPPSPLPAISPSSADTRLNTEYNTWFYVNTKAPGGPQSQWTHPVDDKPPAGEFASPSGPPPAKNEKATYNAEKSEYAQAQQQPYDQQQFAQQQSYQQGPPPQQQQKRGFLSKLTGKASGQQQGYPGGYGGGYGAPPPPGYAQPMGYGQQPMYGGYPQQPMYGQQPMMMQGGRRPGGGLGECLTIEAMGLTPRRRRRLGTWHGWWSSRRNDAGQRHGGREYWFRLDAFVPISHPGVCGVAEGVLSSPIAHTIHHTNKRMGRPPRWRTVRHLTSSRTPPVSFKPFLSTKNTR